MTNIKRHDKGPKGAFHKQEVVNAMEKYTQTRSDHMLAIQRTIDEGC